VTGHVRKAVVPAAGLGTRFLPATKAVPKEMLPVVDRPAIQYVVEEAVSAGLTDILIVSSRNKAEVEDHFDRMPELEAELERTGKAEALEEIRALARMARVHAVRQGQPLGLGHAVSMAADHVGRDTFAVLLPDDLMVDGGALLRGMVEASVAHQASVVALKEVTPEEIVSLGAAAVEPGQPDGGPLVRITGVIEKPAPAEIPSNLALTGRYVFRPGIFDALRQVRPGRGGEIQLTDGIALLLEDEPVYGYVFQDGRYDVGKKLDFLRATVELAAARPDLGPDFRAFLADFCRQEGLC